MSKFTKDISLIELRTMNEETTLNLRVFRTDRQHAKDTWQGTKLLNIIKLGYLI